MALACPLCSPVLGRLCGYQQALTLLQETWIQKFPPPPPAPWVPYGPKLLLGPGHWAVCVHVQGSCCALVQGQQMPGKG